MTSRRFRGLSREWSDFLTCVLLHMLLPLFPIAIEMLSRLDAPSEATLAITAALYAMSIGLSSENKAMFALCVAIGIVFSLVYGLLVKSPGSVPDIKLTSVILIALVFIIHAAERYNRHVADCRPFLEFTSEGSLNE